MLKDHFNYSWKNMCYKLEVSILWDLMPDDQRWRWYNNNRKKVPSKCIELKSSWTPWVYGKISSMKPVPAAKNVGDCCSVQFSHSVVSDSLRPHELQHTRPPCPSPTPRLPPNPCPFNQWCHPLPLSSPSPPALSLSQRQGLFQCVSFSHQVAKVLEFQLQHQSFQWTPRSGLL